MESRNIRIVQLQSAVDGPHSAFAQFSFDPVAGDLYAEPGRLHKCCYKKRVFRCRVGILPNPYRQFPMWVFFEYRFAGTVNCCVEQRESGV